MDRIEKASMTVFALSVAVVVFGIGSCTGTCAGKGAIRKEAAKLGHAQYVTDAETGKPVFTWKEITND